MQSSREVGSPACPGNDVAEAAATVGTTREPSITSETWPATRAHSRVAYAASSGSVIRPSWLVSGPSADWASCNVGISAVSTTC